MRHKLDAQTENAIWMMFEYLANETPETVRHYEPQLRLVAKLLDLDPEIWEEETGLSWHQKELMFLD